MTLKLAAYVLPFISKSPDPETCAYSKVDKAMKAYIDEPNIALIRAELQFCLTNELCMKPMDFFNRRTGRLYFNITSIKPALNIVLADFAQFHDWDEAKIMEEKAVVLQEIIDVSEFKEKNH